MKTDKYYTWSLSPTYNDETSVFFTDALNKEEIKDIINAGVSDVRSSGQHQGTVNTVGQLNNEIRRSNISFLRSDVPENFWFFNKITNIVHGINAQYFNYDMQQIETLQYAEYDSSCNGFYGKHIDMLQHNIPFTRKLSFSIQLSDSDEYEGGDLLLHFSDNPIVTNRSIGSIIFFPSFVLHEVTPVTKGTRRSLVGWVTGPRWK
jgi:PKHD-type hydroxylase